MSKKAPKMPARKLGESIWKNRFIYTFVIPGIVFYIIFRIYPLYFMQIAFRNFRVTRPLEKCDWAGLTYFIELFTSVGFKDALVNTLLINTYKLLVCFPAPILLALMLNELKWNGYKRIAQTVLYLPHFVSWVIISSILINFTSVYGGLFNQIRALFGMEPYTFLAQKSLFRGILVISDLWKETGYGAIIYLAALLAIDPQLYEAAEIDGANRFQRMWHITLAGIKETIVVMLILRVGSMMSGGFSQVYSLLNDQVMSTGDTLDTFVYRMGVSNNRFSYAAAAGIFNAVVAAILLFATDRFAKRIGERGLF